MSLLLSACGGGGAGGPSGLQYTGTTTAATVNVDNAQSLALNVQEGVDAQISAENVPLGALICASTPSCTLSARL